MVMPTVHEYLAEGFNPNKLTIAELVLILNNHHVDIVSKKPKSYYIEMFNSEIAAFGDRILADLENTRIDKRKITDNRNPKRVKVLGVQNTVECPTQERFFIKPELPGVRTAISPKKSVRDRASRYEEMIKEETLKASDDLVKKFDSSSDPIILNDSIKPTLPKNGEFDAAAELHKSAIGLHKTPKKGSKHYYNRILVNSTLVCFLLLLSTYIVYHMVDITEWFKTQSSKSAEALLDEASNRAKMHYEYYSDIIMNFSIQDVAEKASVLVKYAIAQYRSDVLRVLSSYYKWTEIYNLKENVEHLSAFFAANILLVKSVVSDRMEALMKLTKTPQFQGSADQLLFMLSSSLMFAQIMCFKGLRLAKQFISEFTESDAFAQFLEVMGILGDEISHIAKLTSLFLQESGPILSLFYIELCFLVVMGISILALYRCGSPRSKKVE